MKHVNNFNNWKSANNINESLIVTLQVGIILGILGWRGLKILIKKVAEKIGANVELTPAKLKEIVDAIIKDISEVDKSGMKLTELSRELKSRIDAGEIKKIGDIEKALKDFI
jgi:hypothetical protein